MKALLSVYDKTGVVDFGRALRGAGFDLVSTGGTYSTLAQAGLKVQQVSDLTGFPEILDGRVKTLHPKVHGGILARRDVAGHAAQLAEHGIDTIDLVAVNLYPFVQTVSRSEVGLDDVLENIDIGGPTLIRAAAKNFPHVVVVVDSADYAWIAKRLNSPTADGPESTLLSLDERKALAQKAFQHVALYDTAISRYLGGGEDIFQGELTIGYRKVRQLRYGENPHQAASLYVDTLSRGGIATAGQLHGRELSFNNILDIDAAWRVVSGFSEGAATVIKHGNPCGLAVHSDQATAYRRAHGGDPVSAYGGIVGFNRAVEAATAEAMKGIFYEVVVAPAYEDGALEILRKRRNIRLLEVSSLEGPSVDMDVRTILGGALVQSPDAISEDAKLWKIVTEREPTEAERRDMVFAWKAVKHVRSNAIVLAKDNALVGMGAGQPNRVTSVHLALRVAGDRVGGSVLASDAFFPFADGVELAAEGGVAAVVQPGGSVRDQEVIDAVNRLGLAMAFTDIRHFRH